MRPEPLLNKPFGVFVTSSLAGFEAQIPVESMQLSRTAKAKGVCFPGTSSCPLGSDVYNTPLAAG